MRSDEPLRFLFEIFHPKHFYIFRFLIGELERRGHEVSIIARDKDVVFRLLDENGRRYEVYGHHGKSMIAKMAALPGIMRRYHSILRRYRPTMIISKGSPYATVSARLAGTRTVEFPDSEVVLSNRFTIPLASLVISPGTYAEDYGRNHRRISGFLEDAYLHPAHFQPSSDILRLIGVDHGEPYAVLRFVGWFANHDLGEKGFGDRFKSELVERLSEHARVFVSSEAELPAELRPYQLRIPVSRMHDVLYHASLYVGDSQSMATEAALLGTPAVRSNSFVGARDMSNFKILQNEYEMLFNYSRPQEALAKALEILNDPGAKHAWRAKRGAYYRRSGDVNLQILGYLEELEPRLADSGVPGRPAGPVTSSR